MSNDTPTEPVRTTASAAAAGERHGPGDRGGRHGGPGPGMHGQLPPTTAPEDGDSAG